MQTLKQLVHWRGVIGYSYVCFSALISILVRPIPDWLLPLGVVMIGLGLVLFVVQYSSDDIGEPSTLSKQATKALMGLMVMVLVFIAYKHFYQKPRYNEIMAKYAKSK